MLSPQLLEPTAPPALPHPAPSASRSRRSGHGAARFAAFAGWLIALTLMAVAGARIFAPDATVGLIWLNSFTLYLYLPAYFLLAGAVASGRHRLAAVCLLPIAAHLVWIGPDLLGPASQPFGVAAAPRVRIVSANVVSANDQIDELVAEIASARPDVVLIQEYNTHVEQALERSGLAAKLPYRLVSPVRGWGGCAVYSRLPLEETQFEMLSYLPLMRFDLTINGAPLRIYQVHPFAPYRDGMRRMAAEFWQTVVPRLAAETRPFVVIGDFNATSQSLHHAQLRGIGLRSAHQDRGRGLAATWPNGKIPWLPPIRIDHAFLSPQVACLKIREGVGAGSDHRPLMIDLSLPAAE